MVPPLSGVHAGCASCHPADVSEHAGAYAAALGVEVGMGGGGSSSSQPSTSQDESAATVETASKAAEWIPIRPGTDAAFLLAMINILMAVMRARLFTESYYVRVLLPPPQRDPTPYPPTPTR